MMRGDLSQRLLMCLAVWAAGSCAKVVPAGAGPGPGADGSADRVAPVADGGLRDGTALDLSGNSCATTPTTISGITFAPNGWLPLFNVAVYVPTAPLDPLPAGMSCDRCGTVPSGKPTAATLSDATGKFTIKVPAGGNVPLVFQVGKWRRQVTIPGVKTCQDNPISDPNLSRLPRNRKEGDLPRMAVVTGECDQLGCLLPKLGIDLEEVGVSGQDRVATYYLGMGVSPEDAPDKYEFLGPPNMRPSTELWNDEKELSRYDVTILSCECEEHLSNKSAAAFANMTNYLGKGGRLLSTHWSYVWLKNSPDPALTSAVSMVPPEGRVGPGELSIDTSFPKGKAMADWMMTVDPFAPYGRIAFDMVFPNPQSAMPPSARTWATAAPTMNAAGGPRIVTVNTPAGAAVEKQCGRAAYVGGHVVDSPPDPNGKFPNYCNDRLTKGEQSLAFILFDLSACIQDDAIPTVLVIP